MFTLGAPVSVAALLVTALLAGAQAPPRTAQDSVRLAQREALRAVEARMRAARPGTAAMDSARGQRDSIMAAIVAEERSRVDSLREAARRASAAAGPTPRNPLEGDGPFYGYTWVFYADVLSGGFITWFFAFWRRRKRYGHPRLASFLWLVTGGALGVIAFYPLFVFNALFSIGFSAMRPAMLYLLTLFGMVFVIGSAAELGGRRRRLF